MIDSKRALQIAALVLATSTGAAAQGDQSCGQPLTEQLRRFSEQCLSELSAFVVSQPKLGAKVYSEKERYYLVLTRMDDGLLAEAVSRHNFPFMKAETPDLLKGLGWAPPENEADNWKKKFPLDQAKDGRVGLDLGKALAAYGLQPGEAISLTVGPNVSDKPANPG
jgi:hypothetical protein